MAAAASSTCLRCGKKFEPADNDHGACRWHTTSAAVQEILNKIGTVRTELTKFAHEPREFTELYPLFSSGVAAYGRERNRVHVCCGRPESVPDNGCWVGVHSATDPAPDLCIFDGTDENLPTVWEPSYLTGHDAYARLEKFFIDENWEEACKEQYIFNSALGATPTDFCKEGAHTEWSFDEPKFGLIADVDRMGAMHPAAKQFRDSVSKCDPKCWKIAAEKIEKPPSGPRPVRKSRAEIKAEQERGAIRDRAGELLKQIRDLLANQSLTATLFETAGGKNVEKILGKTMKDMGDIVSGTTDPLQAKMTIGETRESLKIEVLGLWRALPKIEEIPAETKRDPAGIAPSIWFGRIDPLVKDLANKRQSISEQKSGIEKSHAGNITDLEKSVKDDEVSLGKFAEVLGKYISEDRAAASQYEKLVADYLGLEKQIDDAVADAKKIPSTVAYWSQ